MPVVLPQGGKAEWHIATGVPFKSKRLGPDEMSAMVDRLCTPKHAEDNMPPKLHVSMSLCRVPCWGPACCFTWPEMALSSCL